jgi:hypothetical protein
MSEIVLQIKDDVSFDRLMVLLGPYKAAKVKELEGKIWNGKAEWLQNPIKIDGFTPLSRDEAHARQGLYRQQI